MLAQDNTLFWTSKREVWGSFCVRPCIFESEDFIRARRALGKRQISWSYQLLNGNLFCCLKNQSKSGTSGRIIKRFISGQIPTMTKWSNHDKDHKWSNSDEDHKLSNSYKWEPSDQILMRTTQGAFQRLLVYEVSRVNLPSPGATVMLSTSRQYLYFRL